MTDSAARVPRHKLLDAPTLARQAAHFELAPDGVQLLVAIDRVLRSLVRGGILDAEASSGWALSGSTALVGVYLRGERPLRVPDELSFSPLSEQPERPAEEMASLVAEALGGSAVPEPETLGHWQVAYAAPTGHALLPLRLERAVLKFLPPLEARSAQHALAGYLYDPRLPYWPRVSRSPITVPVAYAEEILLRDCIALLSGNRDDLAARADDLRLTTIYEGPDLRQALSGPIRSAFLAGLQTRGSLSQEQLQSQLRTIAGNLARALERYDDPSALPRHLRPARAVYDTEAKHRFEADFLHLTQALVEGH